MQDSKENNLNFGKLLKKLQIDNIAIPELRQLKQEHSYLQKLKHQRVKIEELKAKYEHSEHQLTLYAEDSHSQKQLIEEQHKTILVIENKLEESERRKMTLEATLSRTVELEREKQRSKHSQLLSELEEVRRESKAKDLMLFEMEDVLQQQKQHQKEQSSHDRRRIMAEWEEKYKSIVTESNLKDKENDQLKELVSRQHKALQMQNEQFEDSSRRNEELNDLAARLEEELGDSSRLREESEERLSEVVELMNRMESELASCRSGQSAKDQVEELRKKVSEMAKGEIEKIEFIVSEYD